MTQIQCWPRDQINTLPYLDAVIKEAVRLHPPLDTATRQAVRTTAVRLNDPVLGREGKAVEFITVPKGTTVYLREATMPNPYIL